MSEVFSLSVCPVSCVLCVCDLLIVLQTENLVENKK